MHAPLVINKATAHIPIRADAEIDITAIRIGKQRIARNNKHKLSELKKAIIEHRTEAIAASECAPQQTPAEYQELPLSCLDLPVESLDTGKSEKDELCFKILKELSRLQQKGLSQPAEKRYKYKKFVVGFREVERALARNELKGIIVAVNIEEAEDLLQLVDGIRTSCIEKEIPFLRGLTRRRMGKALGKSMKQSLVGIVNLDGVHQDWKALQSLS